MRPSPVVVLSPVLDHQLRIRQRLEPLRLQALIAQPAVESLDVGILDRLPRSHELEGDASRVRPQIERVAGDLGPVIADDAPRQPRVRASGSSTAITRSAGIECATWIAGHSRVKSSTIVRPRNVRPVARASLTKSKLQRSFRAVGKGSGTRAVATRFCRRWRRTATRSSR